MSMKSNNFRSIWHLCPSTIKSQFPDTSIFLTNPIQFQPIQFFRLLWNSANSAWRDIRGNNLRKYIGSDHVHATSVFSWDINSGAVSSPLCRYVMPSSVPLYTNQKLIKPASDQEFPPIPYENHPNHVIYILLTPRSHFIHHHPSIKIFGNHYHLH